MFTSKMLDIKVYISELYDLVSQLQENTKKYQFNLERDLEEALDEVELIAEQVQEIYEVMSSNLGLNYANGEDEC